MGGGQLKQNTLGRIAAVGTLAMMGALGALHGVNDQDATAGHPAHIHAGTCDAPGEVVAPLGDVGGAYLADGTPVAGTEMVGLDSAIAPEVSETTVPVALADIVGGGHTIVIHQSEDDIDEYIACGDIGGMMFGASDLPVGIAPLNDSGVSGIAWLHDNGDGTTTVNVAVTTIEEDEAAEAASGEIVVEGTEVAVTLADFSVTLPADAAFKVGET